MPAAVITGSQPRRAPVPQRVGVVTLGLVLLGLEMQREIWTANALDDATRAWIAPFSVVLLGALAAARRAPLAAVVAGFTAFVLVDLAASPWEAAPVLGFATLPLAYALGRLGAGRRRTLGTAFVAVATTFVAVRYAVDPDTEGYPIGSTITQIALSLAPIWLGATMRDRAALHAALAASAARADTEREATLARTVLEERARIAAELHDLIAHALSAVIVQASAARVHAPRGGEAAAGAFAAVEATGRDALAEIRSMLDVLRGPEDGPGAEVLAPQPQVEHLPALVSRTAVDATLEVSGTPRVLPASVDLTAYRVVQEALSLAAGAGATRATVTVTYGPGTLLVGIVDDGGADRPAPASRERVRLYGGTLAGQHGRDGGWRVRASLPAREATA